MKSLKQMEAEYLAAHPEITRSQRVYIVEEEYRQGKYHYYGKNQEDAYPNEDDAFWRLERVGFRSRSGAKNLLARLKKQNKKLSYHVRLVVLYYQNNERGCERPYSFFSPPAEKSD